MSNKKCKFCGKPVSQEVASKVDMLFRESFSKVKLADFLSPTYSRGLNYSYGEKCPSCWEKEFPGKMRELEMIRRGLR